MIGHAAYPALQHRADQPASLAPSIVSALLRRRLGYRGLILTDDLEMGAVDQSLDGGTLAVAALKAGSDGLMFCRSADRIKAAAEALERGVHDGAIPKEALRESLRRIHAVKRRYLQGRRRARYSKRILVGARALLASLAPASASGADPTARD
jgi:beta-N-acetylhexosaminidase